MHRGTAVVIIYIDRPQRGRSTRMHPNIEEWIPSNISKKRRKHIDLLLTRQKNKKSQFWHVIWIIDALVLFCHWVCTLVSTSARYVRYVNLSEMQPEEMLCILVYWFLLCHNNALISWVNRLWLAAYVELNSV